MEYSSFPEIGSDFEEGSASGRGEGLSLLGAVLTFSGRQALGLIAREALEAGIRSCVLPDHHCYSMAQPFLELGMEVELCGTTSELLLDYDELSAMNLGAGTPRLILHSDTFGCTAEDDLHRVLTELGSDGHRIVVDCTHSILGEPTPSLDYSVASLRKLLPLPDGGAVWGLSSDPTIEASPSSVVNRKLLAADQKRRFLESGVGEKEHLRTFADAEVGFRRVYPPQLISAVSERRLSSFDVRMMRRSRNRNFEVLRNHISLLGVEIVNLRAGGSAPPFLVLRHPDAHSIQRLMASKGIYCPSHWPRPDYVNRRRVWRDDLLSLPVDHRYSSSEMERVAREFASAFIKR